VIKIRIVFFASLREALGEAEMELELDTGLKIQDVVQLLGVSRGEDWLQTLSTDKVLVAVNHTMVDHQHLLEQGDELAFYPPVTGG
jgi:molybdopterin synthase sulfur carrier subunit